MPLWARSTPHNRSSPGDEQPWNRVTPWGRRSRAGGRSGSLCGAAPVPAVGRIPADANSPGGGGAFGPVRQGVFDAVLPPAEGPAGWPDLVETGDRVTGRCPHRPRSGARPVGNASRSNLPRRPRPRVGGPFLRTPARLPEKAIDRYGAQSSNGDVTARMRAVPASSPNPTPKPGRPTRAGWHPPTGSPAPATC